MFANKKDISKLEEKLELEIEFLQRQILALNERITKSDGYLRAKYVWELREEDVELIVDGKKLRKLRKLIY